MNLDELKTAWRVYDQKIKASQTINEKLIESMIKEKSMSRVATIKGHYIGFFALLTIEFILMIAILAGNPFDFTFRWQYIPYILLAAGIGVAFFNLLHLYRKLNPALSNNSIGVFLKSILETYEKNKVFEKWFGVIFLSIGIVIPLSFLPKKLAHNTLFAALIETAIMMAGTLLLYLVAFRMGAFKNRNRDKLANYLQELNELKSISSEINESN